MKVMIVGSDEAHAIENYYVKYLNAEGLDVSQFAAQKIFYEYYHQNNFNKVLYKAGLSSIQNRINKSFIISLEKFRPEIIWVFKGMEITPDSLRYARSKRYKLVNYNPDNPFVFTGSGSGNSNITQSIALYDLHFTYNLQVKRKLEAEYHLPVKFLPFGYDISDGQYQACITEEEIIKTCFIGNPDKKRSAFLKELAESGVKIDLYGHYWNDYIKHPNISIYQPVLGDVLWKMLRKYRVQLNLMRIHNDDSHNMRTFEIPAIGGIQLAPDTPEHQLFFEDRKEVWLYRSVSDCVQCTKELLSLSTTEASNIRLAARKRCVESGYSYRDRALEALTVMRDLINA